ncbi:Response regulator receiver domain-containing protein [Pelagibacterium luteolum]|uniref:Response regulator receiver domain-containing protein n=2 Tax=Pelagibacterium luteolum TaxID=440168 RepID=A0A1G8ALR0_9HYPH|nr:Response regulator receiver domain-containing protein [Pelagibacterium luteolum]
MIRVLYVEDESLLAISVEEVMESEGYRVQLAHDGDEGLELASSFNPQIIVTDYMMPRLDGLSMVRKLREAGVTVPVIVTTAVPEESLSPELQEQYDIYLGKPFTDAEIIDALRRFNVTV